MEAATGGCSAFGTVRLPSPTVVETVRDRGACFGGGSRGAGATPEAARVPPATGWTPGPDRTRALRIQYKRLASAPLRTSQDVVSCRQRTGAHVHPYDEIQFIQKGRGVQVAIQLSLNDETPHTITLPA